jgi:predicted  nucleic acid-binding Zn-ribbon protein
MAIKKAVAKSKVSAKKPAKVITKKPVKTVAAKPAKKTAAKTTAKVAPPSKKAVKPAPKQTAKKVVKPVAAPVHKNNVKKPVIVAEIAVPVTDNNTSKIVDMISEKKAPKVKSTATSEPKEKKPSARAAKAAEKAAAAEPVKERRFSFNLKTFSKDKTEFTTEEKLQALFQLQLIDSEVDRIRILRGELPMEVNDLEDEIAGLNTRIKNYTEEIDGIQALISQKKQAIKDSNAAIKKYESQQMNVKNNREFDSLNKEIEFQQLEIQLSEKRIKEYSGELGTKSTVLESSTQTLNERLEDLKTKKDELDNIIAETRKEEDQLLKFSEQAREMIDERLFSAYERIRENARNGLAVVTIQRDACGGCFNKIPPQRQLDIRQHKKVIVCEHCGRILVDHDIEL